MKCYYFLYLLLAFILNLAFFSHLTTASVIPENSGGFTIDYYALCANEVPPSGCVYDYEFNAIPSEGYRFSHWEIDGLVISQNPYTINFYDSVNGIYDEGEAFTDSLNGIYDEGEDFVDTGNGVYDLGETFTDAPNGVYDLGEDFVDSIGNGVYDLGEEFVDSIGNGVYDLGEEFTDALNGVYDEGEAFVDTNGVYDYAESFTDAGNGVWDDEEVLLTDENNNGVYDDAEELLTDENGNGVCDKAEELTLDYNSNGQWDDGETFNDANGNGTYDVGELFVDADLNGEYTPADTFVDADGDGAWDPADTFVDADNSGAWEAAEIFVDSNGNGWYDIGELFTDVGNGVYDEGEEFVDSNGNGVYDEREAFTDQLNGVYDEGEQFTDALNGFYDQGEDFVDSNGNGVYDDREEFIDINANGQWDPEYRRYVIRRYEEHDGGGYYEWVTESETFSTYNDFERDALAIDGWTLIRIISEEYYELYNDVYDEGEEFIDALNGQYDEGEEFVDATNGVYDIGEPFFDAGNGVYDAEEFTDSNDNGVWDEGEVFVDANNNGVYDAEEFTDSNGNGEYDIGEPFTDSGNGVYDEGEQFTDALNGVYDEGEDFVDLNNNGVYDSSEEFVDLNSNGVYDIGESFTDGNGVYDYGEFFFDALNGVYDEGEEFVDAVNGVYDEGEVFADFNGNGVYDYGEFFFDALNGVYDEGEEFTDALNGVYDYGEDFVDSIGNGVYDYAEPFTDALNGVYDDGEEFIDSNGNGVYDYGESFTDSLNGVYDEGEDFIDALNGVYDYGEEFVDEPEFEHYIFAEYSRTTEQWVNNPSSYSYYDEYEEVFAGSPEENELIENGWSLNSIIIDQELFTDRPNGVYNYAEDFTDAGNGVYDVAEDIDGDGHLDVAEDIDGDGNLDVAEDIDGDGILDPGEDLDGDGNLDVAEDVDGDGLLDLFYEDLDGDGNLDVAEDLDGDSNLDVAEDLNGNGMLDSREDFADSNDNGVWDIGEPFTDAGNGVYDEGENFVDSNGNGVYDYAESFTDAVNGVYDEGENFVDSNGNGIYDIGEVFVDALNGVYDLGEEFTDSPNGVYDAAESFTDALNGVYDYGETFTDALNGVYDEGEDFVDTIGNGVYDLGEEFTDALNGVYDVGEDFVDTGNGVYDLGETFTDAPNGVYDLGEDFVDSIGNGVYDLGEDFVDTIGNGIYDLGEEFTDALNGVYDEGEDFVDSFLNYINPSLIDNIEQFDVKAYFVQDNIIFVDKDAAEGGDGTSWAKAYKNIQDPLLTANEGDQIWIKGGTYYPDEGGFSVADSRSESFIISNGISLYGGFAGNESNINQRDLENNPPTILSGDIDQDGATAGNSYHIMIASDDVVINGFTFQDGYADGLYADSQGAALYCIGVNPTIENTIFQNNYADSYGGAIYQLIQATLKNNQFINNSAKSKGGAIYGLNQSVSESNYYEGNSVTDYSGKGGAIFGLVNSQFKSDEFYNNIANLENGRGGAVANSDDILGDVTDEAYYRDIDRCSFFSDCRFEGNNARYGGALFGIYFVRDSVFEKNNYHDLGNYYNGGAVYGKLLSLNNQFLSNSRIEDGYIRGGALNLVGSGESIIYNSDFINNGYARGDESYGGAVIHDHNTIIVNCIFESNGGEYNRNATSAIESYSSLQCYGSIFVNNYGEFTIRDRSSDTDIEIVNCTFDNQEKFILNYSDRLKVINSIFWHSSSQNFTSNPSFYSGYDSFYSIFSDSSYSNLNGVSSSDPFFQSAGNYLGIDGLARTPDDGYSIRSVSPAIDAGADVPVTFFNDRFDADGDGDTAEAYPYDLKGFLRVQGSGIDIGAYEYGLSYLVSAFNSPVGAGSVSGTGRFNIGLSTELTATPIPGYLFEKWTLANDGSEHLEESISVQVDGNKSYTANYIEDANDNDGDGLTNYQENIIYLTDDSIVDTDSDSIPDGLEVEATLNPLEDSTSAINMFKNNLHLLDIENSGGSGDGMYALEEIKDLRPGSVTIQVVDGEANINMDIESSTDLENWEIDSAITVPMQIEEGEVTKFFRFKMAE